MYATISNNDYNQMPRPVGLAHLLPAVCKVSCVARGVPKGSYGVILSANRFFNSYKAKLYSYCQYGNDIMPAKSGR